MAKNRYIPRNLFLVEATSRRAGVMKHRCESRLGDKNKTKELLDEYEEECHNETADNRDPMNSADAINKIFKKFDELFKNNEFMLADEHLQNENVELHNLTTAIAVLSITLAAKSKLPSRSQFLDKVREHFKQELEIRPKLFDSLE